MTTLLETRLGYSFKEPRRLTEALTHSTYANEHPDAGPHNERLEFLGDAVLGLLAARILYETVPDGEGELSRRRAQVVRRESLATFAQELELGQHLRLGVGQQKAGTQEGSRLLADAYEAVAGAVFLDGGAEAIERCYAPVLERAIAESAGAGDAKTQLQELCHTRGLGQPRYGVSSIEGPDHARTYRCEVTVDGRVLGFGSASSKKAAEQICARAALAELNL